MIFWEIEMNMVVKCTVPGNKQGCVVQNVYYFRMYIIRVKRKVFQILVTVVTIPK